MRNGSAILIVTTASIATGRKTSRRNTGHGVTNTTTTTIRTITTKHLAGCPVLSFGWKGPECPPTTTVPTKPFRLQITNYKSPISLAFHVLNVPIRETVCNDYVRFPFPFLFSVSDNQFDVGKKPIFLRPFCSLIIERSTIRNGEISWSTKFFVLLDNMDGCLVISLFS